MRPSGHTLWWFKHKQKPARLPFHMRKEPATFPWMKLSGRWIQTAGFEPGQRVRITVEHQKLVITPL